MSNTYFILNDKYFECEGELVHIVAKRMYETFEIPERFHHI